MPPGISSISFAIRQKMFTVCSKINRARRWRALLSMLILNYLSVISAWNSCRLLTGRDFFACIEWIATTDALAAAIVVI